MALDPATLEEAGTAFIDALQLGGDARRLVEEELRQLAEVLPEPEAWAALGHGDGATIVLLAGAALLTVGREAGAEGEPQLAVTFNPLRITEATYRQNNQQTSWDFEFRDRDPLRIEGRMTPETLDRAEAFARALAANAGWRIDDQPLIPADAGSPVQGGADSPDQGDTGGPRVTDLWGRPVSKRRRR